MSSCVHPNGGVHYYCFQKKKIYKNLRSAIIIKFILKDVILIIIIVIVILITTKMTTITIAITFLQDAPK